MRSLLFLLAAALLVGCPAPGSLDDDDDLARVTDDDDATTDDDDVANDDDSTTADDDDSTADDDDDSTADDDDVANDDDSIGDDDDSTPPVPTCDDVALEPALATVQSWPRTQSCSYFFSTADAANTFRVGVVFQVGSSVTPTVGMTFSLPFDGSTLSDQVPGSLEVQAGTQLSNLDCNDAIIPGNEPSVTQQWNPIAGTAVMSVDQLTGEAWPGGPMTFQGTVFWSGVVVELEGSPGTTCSVPDATWASLALGWLAG